MRAFAPGGARRFPDGLGEQPALAFGLAPRRGLCMCTLIN